MVNRSEVEIKGPEYSYNKGDEQRARAGTTMEFNQEDGRVIVNQ